ncbi:MAG: type II toxin-antitoxin system HicA family toxin [Nitrospinae bacterium]|nr:type II toxin-antitoxin system HicA family toxin [Nitrospinota bacterium]
MPKLRRLSGAQVIAVLGRFGFYVVGQRGSHVKLARLVGERRQILTVPNHKEIDTGTLKAIYRQASAYVSEVELQTYFYSE